MMSVAPPKKFSCLSLSLACTVMSLVQFFKAIFCFIIFLFYYTTQGFYILAIHHMLLFIFFIICSIFAASVLISLFKKINRPLPFIRLYRCLLSISGLWIIEYCIVLGVSIAFKFEVIRFLQYAFPTAICIVLDLYFSYWLYSYANILAGKGAHQIAPRVEDLTVINAFTRFNAEDSLAPSKKMPKNEENSLQDIKLDSKALAI
ncbi:hypothetical protein SteCoe_22454 [Stentor coeruleus]|uniref:Uncharacterized protein n=1 Tax=Stentor coeruleus TaxID=5963 RepID=A0A1R2BMQ0_9CILI|nr:hypothetical protein SteCoe_22454 [Stentor coeruleus]